MVVILPLISSLLKKDNPLIFCIVELRVDFVHLDRFCFRLDRCWYWVAVEVVGYFEGIITIWHSKIGMVIPVVNSRNIIHLVITSNISNNWILSIV